MEGNYFGTGGLSVVYNPGFEPIRVSIWSARLRERANFLAATGNFVSSYAQSVPIRSTI